MMLILCFSCFTPACTARTCLSPSVCTTLQGSQLNLTLRGSFGAGGSQAQVVQFSAGQTQLDNPVHARLQSQKHAAGRAVSGGRRKLTVEELPAFGDKHRRTPREGVPHDGGLLESFSPWIEVSFFSWRVCNMYNLHL